jgi:hypothetical protein
VDLATGLTRWQDCAKLVPSNKRKGFNVFDTELFVTYNGSVMRWFANGGRSGSDPVGKLSDEEAIEWAESKMALCGCSYLNFTIEE